MYAHMHKLLGPALRKIPYAITGVPISTNAWWEFANAKLHKLGRLARRSLRRIATPNYEELDRSAWPYPGRAMRECQEWHEVLWRHANDSHLADLGILKGDGIRAVITEHLEGREDHTYLLDVWLTVEQWLRHYG